MSEEKVSEVEQEIDEIDYSPGAIDDLTQTDFENEQFQYFELITKSPFALLLTTQIKGWRGKNKPSRSPFTVRTQRGLINLIKAVTDRSVFLSNLTKQKEYQADIEMDLLINVHYQQFDLIDTMKPEFYPIIKLIRQHAWFIRTRAEGGERERMIQRGQKVTQESIMRQGTITQAKEKRGFHLF